MPPRWKVARARALIPFHGALLWVSVMKLIPGGQGDDQLVACPSCGFNHVHFLTITVEPVKGNSRCTIHPEGLDIRQVERSSRGTALMLRLNCENGHVWDSRVRQPKPLMKRNTNLKIRILIVILPRKIEDVMILPLVD